MSDSSPPHVVILEDSPELATAFGRLFIGADYRVTTLADCAVEPDEVIALRPDLVVLDLQCGYGARGLTLVRGLRASPAGCGLPIIASPTMTSCARRKYAAELLALRVDLLPDPFTTQDLIEAACEVLERVGDTRWRSHVILAKLRGIRDNVPPV